MDRVWGRCARVRAGHSPAAGTSTDGVGRVLGRSSVELVGAVTATSVPETGQAGVPFRIAEMMHRESGVAL